MVAEQPPVGAKLNQIFIPLLLPANLPEVDTKTAGKASSDIIAVAVTFLDCTILGRFPQKNFHHNCIIFNIILIGWTHIYFCVGCKAK
jgi:hypothetical protein